MFFQPRALHHCNMAAERIIYVDAGPEVRRRVCPVKHGYQFCEHIVSWHDGGTKVVPVRPERADNQKDGHAGKQKSTDPEIIILVFKKEIENDHCHIGKPQQIGDDENLTEGDQVIRL